VDPSETGGQNPHIFWQSIRIFCHRPARPERQGSIVAQAINSQSKMSALKTRLPAVKVPWHRHLTYTGKQGINRLKPFKSITDIFALELVVPEILMPLPLHDGAAAGRNLADGNMRQGEFIAHIRVWRYLRENNAGSFYAIA
jgi:hypothetical protein